MSLIAKAESPDYLVRKTEKAITVKKAAAKKFLLGRGYFPDRSILPLKINTHGFAGVNLSQLNWSRPGSIPRTSSIDVVVDKDNKGLRRFSLIHPFAYIHLVNEILDNYDEFKDRLYRETQVRSYNVPLLDGDENTKQDWAHFNVTDPSQYFLDHAYIATADINNFYESIYTHSISWALHGKEIAKNNVNDMTMLGNKLDKLMQNSHDGQTNGIPTGNIVSDLISELILKDIDEQLSSILLKDEVKIFRFRDDYRFVCKTKGQARKCLDVLALLLNADYGLTLNQQKTKIEACDEYRVRVSKPEYMVQLPPTFESVDEIFIDWKTIHRYIEDSKLAGKNIKGVFNKQIERLMSTLRLDLAKIIAPDSDDAVDLVYSTLIDSIDSGISTTGHSFFLIDFVVSKVSSSITRARLIDDLYNRFLTSHNESSKLWAYAILLHLDSSKAELFARSQKHPLFKMLATPQTPHSEQFSTRDRIDDANKTELKKLSLIETKLIDDINTIPELDYIFGSIDKEEFEDVTTSHYDW